MGRRILYSVLILIVTGPAFGQTHPVPSLSQPLLPASTAPGGPGFVLTVNGTGFVPGATIHWNGIPQSTSYVSGSRLAAHIGRRSIARAQTATITVTNPGPGGGTSNAVPFSVTASTNSVAFARSTVAVGNAPASVVTADFNNDGIPDLAVATECGSDPNCASGGSVSILLGNGDGTFRQAAPVVTSGHPVYAVAGDFNGDGRQDLAVASAPNCQGCASLTLFLGNGDGTFGTGRSLMTPFDGGFRGLATGDFNGDGHLDLAVSANGYFPYNFTLLGNGDGTFTQTNLNITVVGALATADFNQDGILDLAFTAPLEAFLGKGDGTFAVPPQPAMKAQAAVALEYAALQSMAVGDFNGDGIPDVAYIDPLAQRFYVDRGNGDGTFTSVSSQFASTTAANVATADLNGDGILDLIAVDSAGNLDVSLGYGDGTFQSPIVVSAGNAPTGAIAVGDFNRDGRLDLAVVNSQDGTVSILTQTSGYAATVQPPINPDGTSAFTAAQLILPVRFALTRYGQATCDLPQATISVSRTAGERVGTLSPWSYATLTDPGPFFRINRHACEETYDLAAWRLGPGSYQVSITMDGSAVGQATFALQ